MVKTLKQQNIELVSLSSLTLGSVIVGIDKLIHNVKIESNNKFFLAKYGFYNLSVNRNNKIISINGDQLNDGDIVEDLGLLRWPLNLSSEHQLSILKSLGVGKVFTVLSSIVNRKDEFYTVEKVSLNKNPSISRVDKKVSVLLSEFHQLQDNVTEAEKVQEEGYEILQELFEQGNFQPVTIKGVERFASSIYNSSKGSAKASNLLMTLKDHDEYTFRHCIDVTNQLVFIIKYMGNYEFKELQDVTIGAILHDIGKSKIPLKILTKPGKLDNQEWKMMKMHPIYSADIMKKMGLNKLQIDMGHYHHLRKNGTGYPQGYEYDQLPEVVRLLMIVDVYQALVTQRPYRKTESAYSAITRIHSWSGLLFDSWLVDIFIKAFGLYPVGSFVRLNDFRYGFVISNDKYSLKPTVLVCFDKNRNKITRPDFIDLSLEDNKILEINAAIDHRDFFSNNDALEFFLSLDY